MTEAARREIRGRYPGEPESKFLCVPNGYDSVAGKQPAGVTGSDGVVTLTYIGTVYGSTDPGTFVAAVLGLPEAVRSRLKVRFIGHIETPAYRKTLESLGGTVELRGFVPQGPRRCGRSATRPICC